MEFSQFDRHPAYAASEGDRRADDRRAALRREQDRHERIRSMAAFIFAFCGGLAVLYVFFAVIGAVDFGDAIVATLIALAFAVVWLLGFWRRLHGDAALVQRPDRERRGF